MNKKKYTEKELLSLTEKDIKDPRYRILYRLLREMQDELKEIKYELQTKQA